MGEYMENQMDQQIEGGIYAELEQVCKALEAENAELKDRNYHLENTRLKEIAHIQADAQNIVIKVIKECQDNASENGYHDTVKDLDLLLEKVDEQLRNSE